MSARSMLAFVFVAAAITGGCDREREVPVQGPPPAATQPMSKDCDMSGMDMSKMSAEEHQKMMDECARQQQNAPK